MRTILLFSGTFLLPGKPRTPWLATFKQQPQDDCYRLHLLFFDPLYSGIILGKNYFFIKHVDPTSLPKILTVEMSLHNGGSAGYRPRVRNPYFKQRLSP